MTHKLESIAPASFLAGPSPINDWLVKHDTHLTAVCAPVAWRYGTDADDLAQQLRLKIFRHFREDPSRLEGITSVRAYLAICARRLACSELRKKLARPAAKAIGEATELPQIAPAACAALDEVLHAMKNGLTLKERSRLVTTAARRADIETHELGSACEEAGATPLPLPASPQEQAAEDRAFNRAQHKLKSLLSGEVWNMLERMGMAAGVLLLVLTAWSLLASGAASRDAVHQSPDAERRLAGHRSHDPSNLPPLAALPTKLAFPWQLGHRS